MELKKNPNVDPKRNSMLFFQIGLVAVLLLTYFGIEFKTMDPKQDKEEELITDNLKADDEEDVVITLPPVQQAPPPPPPAPEVIEVVKNEIKIEDKKIETTETNENKETIIDKRSSASDVGSSGGGDIEDIDVDVPFKAIEQVPLFPGCEGKPKDQQMACFEEKMGEHVRKNFRYPERAAEDGIQGRVAVQFIIDKTGTVTDLKYRFQGKPGVNGAELEKEAQRIMSKLPKFQPGKQQGKPVRVQYAIPIMFTLK